MNDSHHSASSISDHSDHNVHQSMGDMNRAHDTMKDIQKTNNRQMITDPSQISVNDPLHHINSSNMNENGRHSTMKMTDEMKHKSTLQDNISNYIDSDSDSTKSVLSQITSNNSVSQSNPATQTDHVTQNRAGTDSLSAIHNDIANPTAPANTANSTIKNDSVTQNDSVTLTNTAPQTDIVTRTELPTAVIVTENVFLKAGDCVHYAGFKILKSDFHWIERAKFWLFYINIFTI